MIWADKIAAVAGLLAAKAHAAVGADVFHHVDLTLLITHHNDRTLADYAADEITGMRNLGFQGDIAPVLAVKDFLQFSLINIIAGVGPERDAAGAVIWLQ